MRPGAVRENRALAVLWDGAAGLGVVTNTEPSRASTPTNGPSTHRHPNKSRRTRFERNQWPQTLPIVTIDAIIEAVVTHIPMIVVNTIFEAIITGVARPVNKPLRLLVL